MTNVKSNGSGAQSTTQRLNAQQAFARADAFASAGRHAEAEPIYRQLLEAYPAEPAVLNAFALSLKARGVFDEAEALFRRAIAAAPNEPGFHNNLGNLLRRKQAYSDAESEYRAALALNPRDADARYNLGLTLEDLDRTDEAVQAFEAAIALRPNYHKALTRLGAIRGQQEKHDEAIALFDRAIAAAPDFFDAHYYRGNSLFLLNRFGDAEAAQRRALQLKPDNFQANVALGNTLNAAGNDNEALASYWRAAELQPDYLGVHYGYSQLAWQMGRKDLYRRSYARARTLIGPRTDLLMQEARMLVAQANHADAEQLLRVAQRVPPERADVLAALGEVLTSAKQWDESRSLFERALQLEPQSAAHRRSLAVMLLHAGDVRAARQVLEDAQALDPADQFTLALLGLAYREGEDMDAFGRLMNFEKYVRAYDIALPKGFGDVNSFNNALASELELLHTRKVEPFDQTLRGGSQTMGNLFTDPSLAVGLVRDSIAEAVASYVRELPNDSNHPLTARKQDDFSFSGSWSCRLNSSGYHTNHVHPKGWISSAYYVHLPDAVDDEAGRQGWLKFGESNLALGERDKPARHERPAVGRLVLFPSYFWHGTVPFQSADNRLTVAFDVVPGKVAPPVTAKPY